MEEKKEIVIELKNLVKQYRKQIAVDNVNLEINKGGIYGLIGPNGAGKTTIMRMIGGLVIPTEGEVKLYVDGKIADPDIARKKMSFMIESPYLNPDLNAYQNLEKFRILYGIKDKNIVKDILFKVGLGGIDKKKAVKKFSLGMKQRLGIAIVLLNNPDVLVLDEPINGLDPEGIIEIRELLLSLNKESNMTILISSHILSELSQLCSDYLFINKGKIIKNVSKQELLNECGENLFIHTDDDEKAELILKEKCGVEDIEKKDEFIVLKNTENVREISKTLFENGVIPVHISTNIRELESYYMSVITDNIGK